MGPKMPSLLCAHPPLLQGNEQVKAVRRGNIHTELCQFWEILWELGIHNQRQGFHTE